MQLSVGVRRASACRFRPCRNYAPALKRRRCFVVAAQQSSEKKDSDKKQIEPDPKKVDKVLKELKESGWDKSKASDALSKWSKLGASTDPEELRKLLVKSSLKPLNTLIIQASLDGIACAGGFFIANSVRTGAPFLGDIVIEFLGYAFGLYYLLQVTFEVFALGTILVAAYRFNANPEVYLKAVTNLAGPPAGLSVIDKAQRAVNTAKVFQVLLEIMEVLKDQHPESSTLSNLSAYLTLNRAEKKFGFVPADYGLSDKEAADVAAVFARYDANDDMRIEPSELRNITYSLGKDLSDDEVKEAVNLLDSDKSGYIEFGEFVAWWVGRKGLASQS